ncbi:Nucleoporin nup93 [Cichlidogyrus casuarinus]|uniref:Nuclear pore protein n=1 Tax=Cichlidogyrus casuarinus TaxID=1844966 RepID=A0ABD2QC31_9PLAT
MQLCSFFSGKYANYIEAYVENRQAISSNMTSELRHVCKQLAQCSSDVYKQAVFSLLCRQEFSDTQNAVLKSADDFLWFKLSQIVLFADGQRSVSQANSLASLQKLIHDTYGEAHFQAADQPLLFFKLLLLSQQFEAAVSFLFRAQSTDESMDSLSIHAVHLAICLMHMGLLCVFAGEECICNPLR